MGKHKQEKQLELNSNRICLDNIDINRVEGIEVYSRLLHETMSIKEYINYYYYGDGSKLDFSVIGKDIWKIPICKALFDNNIVGFNLKQCDDIILKILNKNKEKAWVQITM